MLIRIVRMEFIPDKTPEFLSIFEFAKPFILNQKGCIGVTLHRDAQFPNVYYTHSQWIDETALNEYRNSDFFKDTWLKTKALFQSKAQAFSLIDIT